MQQELIIGSLLGDGYLELHSHCKNPNLRICRTLNDLEYLTWEANIMGWFVTPSGIKKYSNFDKRTGKTYHSCRFSTVATPLLLFYHESWYKNKTKILPENLELTPLILAIWFADDGNLYGMKDYRCNKIYHHRIHLKLATHCFTIEENERLRFMLNSRYKTNKYKVCHGSTERYIYCGDIATSKLFLREIDSVFPPISRKSDLWRKKEAKLYWDKPNIICKFCESNTYKNGTVKGVQKYLCKTCKRQFLIN